MGIQRIRTDFIVSKLLAILSVSSLLLVTLAAVQNRDPKAWGSNHVGKPVPEYVQGDECLFCHRNDIGPTWQKNSHLLTVRERESAPEVAAQLKSTSQGRLPQLSHYLDHGFGNLPGGERARAVFDRQEMKDAVGQLASDQGIGGAGALQGSKQRAADLVGFERRQPSVAFVDPNRLVRGWRNHPVILQVPHETIGRRQPQNEQRIA